MYGPDVFAVLTAGDSKNKASSAFDLPENERWFRRAVGGVVTAPTIDIREATPAGDLGSDDNRDTSAVNRLVVTFDKLLESPLLGGLRFGTSPPPASHILLGHRGTKGISALQYNITVDLNLNIWLHDFHSTYGTAVMHNGQNREEVRRRETWILAFTPNVRKQFNEIVIYTNGLGICIEFPNHDCDNAQYRANLQAFAKKCKEAAEISKEEVPTIDALL